MDFKRKTTGIIYHVTNDALLPHYEANTEFEKVEKKPAKPVKKAGNKAKSEDSLN